MSSSLKRILYDTVEWELWKGISKEGTPEYYEPAQVKCRVLGSMEWIVDVRGEQVLSNYQLVVLPSLLHFTPTYKDLITLPDGRTFGIKRLDEHRVKPKGIHSYLVHL